MIEIKIGGANSTNGSKKKGKPKIPDEQLAHLKDDPVAKEARQERLRKLDTDRKERTYEWVQEDHENEAEKGNYWLDGGTKFDYQEMVIQFGYVTLFSMGFPLAPLIAYLNNLLEMRTDSFKMNATQQRPQYRVLEGIGMWDEVLYFMVTASIFINMTMIVLYDYARIDGHMFPTDNIMSVMIVLICAEHGVVFLKIMCEQFIPDTTKWLDTAKMGYDYLQEKSLDDGDNFGMKKTDSKLKCEHILESFANATREIEEIFWSEAKGNPELGKMREKRKKVEAGGADGKE